MNHIYREGKEGHPVFILLHGTGGDETNLLPLGEALDPEATLLSIRGNISENGMPRFFKRKAEGVYDVEDLNYQGELLYQFIEEASQEYKFNLEDAIYVGFSNGSNIAINMLLLEGAQVMKGALFAPMYPVDLSDNTKDLTDVSVYLSMGQADPIVSQTHSEEVIDIFESRNASVEKFWVNSHEISLESLQKAKEWLANLT